MNKIINNFLFLLTKNMPNLILLQIIELSKIQLFFL